jgi:hypothetical protein
MRIEKLLCRTACVAALSVGTGGLALADTMEGVWWSTVMRVDCSTGAELGGFTGMQVYHQGGTLTDTNSGPPTSRGPGMGTWRRSGTEIETRFRFMLFAPTGQWTGTAVVTRALTPAPDGDNATGSGSAEVYNPAGQLVGGSCTRDVSVRLR